MTGADELGAIVVPQCSEICLHMAVFPLNPCRNEDRDKKNTLVKTMHFQTLLLFS